MMHLMTSTDLMRALRISRSTLYRLKKRGLPTVGGGKLARYDSEQALEWFHWYSHQTNTPTNILAAGDYRCGTCGFEGTLPVAIALTQRGPCPQCGSRDIPVRVNDHSSADTIRKFC